MVVVVARGSTSFECSRSGLEQLREIANVEDDSMPRRILRA